MFRYALILLIPVACMAQATSYLITTVAGNSSGIAGFTGDGGAATSAEMDAPIAVALDSSGNLYISDSVNNRIRKVTSAASGTGKISTYVGAGGAAYSGDGGAAASAQLSSPYGIWVDAHGNLDIADLGNQVIRQVSPTGTITTIVGTNQFGFAGDGGPAISAEMNQPVAVATDPAGNLYISDSKNNRIRIVTPDGNINTLVGTGWVNKGCPNSAVNMAAQNVTVQTPLGLATDSAGNLYLADSQNNCVRMVTPGPGNIVTIAGNGTAGISGDGGAAVNAKLNQPYAVAVDSSGDIFIADYTNSRVRMVTPDGNINTIAGGTGFGYTGDNTGIVATNAKLNFPTGLAVDNAGHIFIADSANNVIRMLTPMAPSVSSGGVITASAFGAFSSVAPGSWIEIYGSNLSVDRRSWTGNDFQGNTAPSSLDGTKVTIGGQPAFVYYISGSQISVQVPSNISTGSQPVVVQTPYGTYSTTVNVNSVQPGLWAPSLFNIGGVQYVGAVLPDGKTFILPTGAVSGLTSRPAKAGDIITLYGVGFGAVTPSVAAGQIAPASTSFTNPPQFFFGQTAATLQYAGLAPGEVGLYQFNVVVPQNLPAGKYALTFTLNGQPGSQTLYVVTQ